MQLVQILVHIESPSNPDLPTQGLAAIRAKGGSPVVGETLKVSLSLIYFLWVWIPLPIPSTGILTAEEGSAGARGPSVGTGHVNSVHGLWWLQPHQSPRLLLICCLHKHQSWLPYPVQMSFKVWANSISHDWALLSQPWQPLPLCGVALQSRLEGAGPGLRLGHACQQSRKTGWRYLQFQPASSSLLRKYTSECALHRWKPSLLPALSWVPLVFKPALRSHLPGVRLQGWDTQYVAQTPHSPGRISTHVTPLPTSVSPPRAPATSLPFLLDSLWIFLSPLVVQESFCRSPVHFQWELLPYVNVLLLCLWEEGSAASALSVCLLDHNLNFVHS